MSPDGEFEREIVRRLAAELDELSGPDPRWSEARVAGRVRRRPIGRGLPLLVAAAIVFGSSLVGAWLLSGTNSVRPSPSTATSETPDFKASLRRPLLIPALGSSGACPVTAIGLTLESLGQFQGSGPVRVNNLNDVPIYELPYRNGWYGQKVFWAVDAREPGPILVRVVRIDAPGEVGLGNGLAPELMLSNDYGGDAVVGTAPPFPIARIFIDFVSFRTPGCYLMQMDGPATTSTVVFRALGASVVPSPSPTMAIGCGIFPSELDLCQQAVIVAEGRLPANQQPPLAVALRATQTMSICPPSVSYDPAHPETCEVVAHVTTKSGTVDMVLRLSPTGWMFEFFIK